MYIFLNIMLVLCLIASLVLLIFAIKSKRTFKTLAFNAFLGISILLIFNLTSKLTHIEIFVNKLTVITASVFGIPGVLALLLLNMIF